MKSGGKKHVVNDDKNKVNGKGGQVDERNIRGFKVIFLSMVYRVL